MKQSELCKLANVPKSSLSLYLSGAYEPKQDRKLLLTKQEIKKWTNQLKTSGITIVPIKMFINDTGLCKVQIALARGKKIYDKRASIKEKDLKREQERNNI